MILCADIDLRWYLYAAIIEGVRFFVIGYLCGESKIFLLSVGMSKKELAIESYGGVGDHEVGNNLTGSAHTLKVMQVQDEVKKDLAKIGIDCGGYQ